MQTIIGASVDIETTGLTPGIHEMVQLAVIPYNNKYEPVCKFVSYVKPLKPEFVDPEALKVNGLNLEMLSKQPTPIMVRKAFTDWKESRIGEIRLRMLGKNVGQFDMQFLKLFFTASVFNSLFHNRVDDITGITQAMINVGRLPADLKTDSASIFKFLGIELKPHDACEDAMATLKAYKKLLDIMK